MRGTQSILLILGRVEKRPPDSGSFGMDESIEVKLAAGSPGTVPQFWTKREGLCRFTGVFSEDEDASSKLLLASYVTNLARAHGRSSPSPQPVACEKRQKVSRTAPLSCLKRGWLGQAGGNTHHTVHGGIRGLIGESYKDWIFFFEKLGRVGRK